MENEKKKILIVEDEKKIAQVLAYNMKKEGYDCEIAYDGESGSARTSDEPPARSCGSKRRTRESSPSGSLSSTGHTIL